MKKNEIMFDRRVVEKNLREGLIAAADYEKFLKSLPNSEEGAQWIAVEELAPRAYLKFILGSESPPSD